MNTIERPDSTTVIFQHNAHLIKDAKELKNVMETTKGMHSFVIKRGVNLDTLQPYVIIGFAKTSDDISAAIYYMAPLEITVPYANEMKGLE